MNRLLPGVGWNLILVTKGSSQLHKMYQSRCTAKNSWWWAERLHETCRVVVPIKLEFNASVGFIHKESVTMHGHTIIKFNTVCFSSRIYTGNFTAIMAYIILGLLLHVITIHRNQPSPKNMFSGFIQPFVRHPESKRSSKFTKVVVCNLWPSTSS